MPGSMAVVSRFKETLWQGDLLHNEDMALGTVIVWKDAQLLKRQGRVRGHDFGTPAS